MKQIIEISYSYLDIEFKLYISKKNSDLII